MTWFLRSFLIFILQLLEVNALFSNFGHLSLHSLLWHQVELHFSFSILSFFIVIPFIYALAQLNPCKALHNVYTFLQCFKYYLLKFPQVNPDCWNQFVGLKKERWLILILTFFLLLNQFRLLAVPGQKAVLAIFHFNLQVS